MKICKQLSLANAKTSLTIYFICFLVLSIVSVSLTAQESTPSVSQVDTEPVARNAWEEIYFRISETYSPPSLLELLKSMELESDQTGLASTYALILHDQIGTFYQHRGENYVYTEQIFVFLLDKIAEQASTVAKENPEIANTIALGLIPELGFDVIMGKANYVLGRLGAKDYAVSIARRLEDINNILTVDETNDFIDFNYAASGCINALALFKIPESFSVLYQVANGPFDQLVRDNAAKVLSALMKEQPEQVEEQFTAYAKNSRDLDNLNMIIDSMQDGEFSFSDEAVNKLNLVLLTQMNETTWSFSLADDSQNKKAEILRKTIDHILANGAPGLEEEVTEQLKQSYLDSDNISVKLLALQGIGMMKSEKGLKFLRDEVGHLNQLQRSDSINYNDERILRQLMYALRISEDNSTKTVAILQDISVTPYSAMIRKLATDILSQISKSGMQS